jgi:hypothetical protein
MRSSLTGHFNPLALSARRRGIHALLCSGSPLANRKLREYHAAKITEMIRELRDAGTKVDQDPATDLLTVNHEFTASLAPGTLPRDPNM